jgi:hypothetical protein
MRPAFFRGSLCSSAADVPSPGLPAVGLPSPPLEGCIGAASSLCSPDSVLPPPSPFQQVCGERARPASYAGGQEGAEDEAEGGESKARRGKLSKKHVQELESIFRANPAGAPGKARSLPPTQLRPTLRWANGLPGVQSKYRGGDGHQREKDSG